MLKPIWKKRDQFGEWIFGLSPDDVERVRQGYACSRCLEEFDTHTKVCPVCREPTEILSDFVIVPTPEEWASYLREHAAPTGRR
jgi:RNA polymerase subunit RPABC4/transcription elongation factor Spt4